jgi:tetratricopeptide (TPR) repeat protein
MNWEKMKVAIKITTDTKANAVASINQGMGVYGRAWYDYAAAAEYYVQNDLDIEKANEWATLSTKLNENHFFAQWIMAQVKAKQGNYKEAITIAKKAQEMGVKNGGGFYNARKASITTSLTEWAKKAIKIKK